MKQVSPARLTKPLRRKAGAKRGESEFEEISWDEAMSMLAERLGEAARRGPEEVRAVHRPRPDAGPDRHVRQAVRHAELCRPRRLLLGEHGRRHDLHHRRLVLGVRRAGPGARQAVRDDRHRRGPPLQPAQDRDLQVQAPRRALHLHQPGAHRLLRHRRRVGADQARHRRRAVPGADPRDPQARPVRPRVPDPVHQRRRAGHRRPERDDHGMFYRDKDAEIVEGCTTRRTSSGGTATRTARC
jgi:hypothetical protein